MNTIPLNLAIVRAETLFGHAVVKAGDTPECRKMIIDQMVDNFCLVADCIGMENVVNVFPGIDKLVNSLIRKALNLKS